MQNKINNTILLFLSLFIGVGIVNAQQIPLKSLYLYNRMSYNPSETGTRSYIPIYLSARKQWIGVEHAPVTQDVSFHLPISTKFGLGMNLYNEVTGASDRTGGNLSLSYRIKTTAKTNLSFGVSALFTQFSFDKNQIVTQNPNDNAINNNNLSYFIPDAAFGMTYYGDNFRIGLSAVNLIQTKKDLSSVAVNNILDRVYYFDASAKLRMSNKLDLIPSIWTRYMPQAPFVLEGNLRLMYNKMLWLGAGYRSQDAVVLELGIEFKRFVVGYAYDYTLSDINTVSNGTHELVIGYQIGIDTSPKTSSWKTRNRIYTNSRK